MSILVASVAIGGCATTQPITTIQAHPETDATVRQLANGMTVIVQATRTAPVVSVRAYVRAGSLYEEPWLGCGLSHILEHLMAQEAGPDGAAPAGQPREKRSRTLEIGGQSNAYTTLGHTCYYIAAASTKAMECIDLIADQISTVNITEEDFKREHGVVQREMDMGKDNPGRQMGYAHMANMFGTHPAALPTIGLPGPLARVTRDDVLAYVKRMYVPQNMVFVVVGDVDVEAVLKRIETKFAGFGQAIPPSLDLPDVPAVTGIRRQTVTHSRISETLQRISFRSIPLAHEDLYALDVLSFILTQGPSSRLVKSLKYDRRLVTSVSSGSWTPAWGAGFFTLSFRSKPDLAEQAEQAILQELRRVVADGVEAPELARAKRQKQAELVYARQTAESIASNLARDYLSTGDIDFSRNYVRMIQAVTPEQVARVARKYLALDRMVITRMVPPSRVEDGPAEVARAARTEATTFTLPNGLRVILHPKPTVGLVSMILASAGGLLMENAETNGLGSLTMAMTTRGAGGRSAEQIAGFFDAAGGAISGRCGNNSFYWEASTLDDRFDGALEILADVVQRPTFPDGELTALRPLALAAIQRVDEHWLSQLRKFFHRKFFTASPYGMHPSGSADVVTKATVAQLAGWHKRHIKAGSSVLAIYGNFDAPAARKRIERLFAALPAGKVTVPVAKARKVKPRGERYVLETDNRQAGILLAVPSVRVTDLDDRLALTVLDTIISGYRLPSGWLHTELRGKKLVYVVHAYNWPGLSPGAFVVYAGAQPDKAEEVVGIIRKNLDKAATYTPTRKEVDRAVNVILTADALRAQSMSAQAMGSALDELYGLGYDFRHKAVELYRAVTPAMVSRVAKKYLGKGYVVIVTTPKRKGS